MKIPIISIFMMLTALFCYADWRSEQWFPEPFTGAFGGGPTTGKVTHSTGGAIGLTGDRNGYLYIIDGQRIDVVTPSGQRHVLAGTGNAGFRDGKAKSALFNLMNRSYNPRSITCDKNGNIFVGDDGNGRVRRIFKSGDEWLVETWAGGGTVRLSEGGTASAKTVLLGNTFVIAANSYGEVLVATNSVCYKVSSDGSTVTHLGSWPESARGSRTSLALQMGASDTVGKVYFISRTPNSAVMVKDDSLIHAAGMPDMKEMPDGPPLQTGFDTPSSIAAEPGGECFYVCGGDHYLIRRMPTDRISTSSTLGRNGRWIVASNTDHNAMASTVFDSSGINLTKPLLMVSHLGGNDIEGNLYGWLNDWKGVSITIANKGPVPTRVFKLTRVRR